MTSNTQDLAYNHFIDLLSKIILKYHQNCLKADKEKPPTEEDIKGGTKE